ncbi:phage tail protein [Salmonella enterica]|uniref:Phage tail protein n=3 Tax=Salmonella enterica TaxID=28901 RepID=A0A618H6J4_SALER|nr:phage tail protein [Salmonella enterica]ECC2872231.1 phage tail protein [Salmonella enterica subsp. enterica serovar Tanger]ECC3903188.1 phage tail protein [Salmonella enterica subsp. enterica]ECD7634876.1 phage tail protein [Salmonella enterica subsp. enterica serovar Poona]ECO1003408.1 phage tail protein [Salmonella enterica subsp. enterica serovar Give]ECR6166010.1 phage tail protein [Salmonella enterica subsp. enterica serovar Muenchen]ECS7054905.1 phage tail protein [Salmonella enteri
MDNYRTIQGDAWDSIAARLYGNEYLSCLLIDANPKHRLTVLFSAGVILTVPDAPAKPATVNNLPPWKRNSVT